LLAGENAQELGGCCISASLRDYARLGIFVKNDGQLPSGDSILPDGWMEEATTPSKGYDGYGYYWWLRGDDVYNASGIFGQMIYIDKKRDIVIALHSNAPAAVGTEYHKHYIAAAKVIAESYSSK
jgi:CubicO group peptidase (beta-lactamase class C family)